MGAFYSGIDDNNDKSGIYYSAVIGKLTDTSFEHVIRFNLYEQKKKCVLNDVFEVPVKEVTVPKEWLDKVDDATTSMMPSTVPGNRRAGRFNTPQVPSLWDQRNNSELGDMPFGFKEIATPWGNGGNKHTKGKGAMEDKITDLGPVDDFYVPGPQDEYEAMLTRMAKAAQQDIEQLGLGVGIDNDEDDEVAVVSGKYGKEAGDSFELISDFLVNLEECDEPLTEIMSTCFAMMSSEGQRRIQTNGLQF